jgi:WD40 repeat protein
MLIATGYWNRFFVAILLMFIFVMPAGLWAQEDSPPPFQADEVRLLRVLTLLLHDGTVIETSFSPGGQVFLTGTLDGRLHVWQAGENPDWTRGALRFVLDGYIPGATLTAFDSDESRLATTATASSTAIDIRDLASGELISSFEGHSSPADSITFVGDGSTVISTDFNGDLFIWDADSGDTLDQFSDVLSMSVSSDGEQLAVLTGDQIITLGPINTPEDRIMLEALAARQLEFSPGGRWLASWGDHLTVWEAEAGEMRFRQRNVRADGVDWSPDSRFLISHSFDSAQVWAVSENPDLEYDTGDMIDALPPFAEAGGLRQFLVSPNGERAITVDLTGVGRLWRINAEGQMDQIRAFTGLVDLVLFSPDSETIVIFRQDFPVRFWNVNGDLRAELDLPDTVIFSPDWRLLASHSDEIVAWRGFTSDGFTFDFPPVGRPQGRSNLRPIPSDEIARIVGLDSTQGIFAIGRTVDASWFQAILEDGTRGWVSANSLQVEASEELIAALPSVAVARTAPQNLLDDIPFLVSPGPAPLDAETGLRGCSANRQVLILDYQEVDDVVYVQIDCGDVTGWLVEDFLLFEDTE